jgi:hypothetical protein
MTSGKPPSKSCDIKGSRRVARGKTRESYLAHICLHAGTSRSWTQTSVTGTRRAHISGMIRDKTCLVRQVRTSCKSPMAANLAGGSVHSNCSRACNALHAKTHSSSNKHGHSSIVHCINVFTRSVANACDWRSCSPIIAIMGGAAR